MQNAAKEETELAGVQAVPKKYGAGWRIHHRKAEFHQGVASECYELIIHRVTYEAPDNNLGDVS